MLIIGEIVKAQGIAGELKIKPLTNDIARFKKLRAAYIDTALCQILGVRDYNGFVFIRFALVDSREKAEALIGKSIGIDRVHAITTDKDEYFIVDLIGSIFIIDGKAAGKIINVYQHGAADVFEVSLTEGKTLLFPFLKKLNLDVDIQNSTVSVIGHDLWEVAVIN